MAEQEWPVVGGEYRDKHGMAARRAVESIDCGIVRYRLRFDIDGTLETDHRSAPVCVFREWCLPGGQSSIPDLTAQVAMLRAALERLVAARWMVSVDWTLRSKYEAIVENARVALAATEDAK